MSTHTKLDAIISLCEAAKSLSAAGDDVVACLKSIVATLPTAEQKEAQRKEQQEADWETTYRRAIHKGLGVNPTQYVQPLADVRLGRINPGDVTDAVMPANLPVHD